MIQIPTNLIGEYTTFIEFRGVKVARHRYYVKSGCIIILIFKNLWSGLEKSLFSTLINFIFQDLTKLLYDPNLLHIFALYTLFAVVVIRF